uniref:NADH-ubiquinone oxidoreductase chain 3 n=1 Tax=Cercaria capricornia TaxID=1542953 RepID=A0A2I6K2B7_9TREM|nr:NADH dehydrogenase subunit 3 [Cercaria capricornia]AUL93153.1 NADH dehydrogenase subunit 3 [Cercaria capricornia]
MVLVFSSFFLFLLIFFLVLVFHGYFWSADWFSLEGVRSWVSPFECGFLPQRLVENPFSYTYFILLVFFVVFDLEISLLLNMPLQGLLFKNMPYYLFFLFLLSVGFSFEVSKGYVEWGY